MATVPSPVVPMVVVVGASVGLLTRCREACDAWGVLAVPCDVASLRDLARRWRPIAMVFLDEVLAFDPAGFRALAAQVGAAVVALPSAEEPTAIVRAALEPVVRPRRRRP